MEKQIIKIIVGGSDYDAINKPILQFDLKKDNVFRTDGRIALYIPSIANLLNSKLGSPIYYTSENATKVKQDILWAKWFVAQKYEQSKPYYEKWDLKVSNISYQIIPNLHGCFVLHNIINSQNEQIVFKKYGDVYKLSYKWSNRPLSRDTIKQILSTLCNWYVQRNNDCTPWALNNRTGTCPRNIVEIAASLHPASLPLIEVIDT